MAAQSRALGVAAIAAAAVLWGSTGTIQALLPADRQPLIVATARMLIAATALALLACVSPSDRRALSRLPVGPVLAAGVAIGLYNLLFFAAILQTGIALGTAIAIGSAPIWVAGFDLLVRRQIPPRWRSVGQVICIAGATVLVVSGQEGGASTTVGLVLAALAGAAYAAYSLVTSAVDPRVPANVLAAATFAVAALVCSPTLLVWPVQWALAPPTMALLAALGLAATALAYALYTWALRSVAPSVAVTLALIEPLTAWLLATFVIGEPVTALRIAGAALLLAGLAIVTRATPDALDPLSRDRGTGARSDHAGDARSGA